MAGGEDEKALIGGNASVSVSRVGNTVRKPWLPTTPHTIAYLRHLEQAGIDVPHVHGRDQQGRLVLDYIPGTLAMDLAPPDPELVHRVGGLVRRIHDTSATLPLPDNWPVLLPAPHDELVCHNDLATWNLIIDGSRLVFIDWDGAGPSNRLWDLAYAAIAFAHLFPDANPSEAAERLAAFADGYDAGPAMRDALPQALEERSAAMWQHLRAAHRDGFEPWASMYIEGHGRHWHDTTKFIHHHHDTWQTALRTPES